MSSTWFFFSLLTILTDKMSLPPLTTNLQLTYSLKVAKD